MSVEAELKALNEKMDSLAYKIKKIQAVLAILAEADVESRAFFDSLPVEMEEEDEED